MTRDPRGDCCQIGPGTALDEDLICRAANRQPFPGRDPAVGARDWRGTAASGWRGAPTAPGSGPAPGTPKRSLAVRIFGPLGSRLFGGCLDSASDDTPFPRALTRRLGIDRTGAPQVEARPVGGVAVLYSRATVTLRLTDGRETCEWQAPVRFVDAPLTGVYIILIVYI
jgi:hypothetical protein